MVSLLSNIPHYNYTAEALAEQGWLDRYYTSWTLLDGERPPFYLPGFYRRKLEGRRLAAVPGLAVTRLLLPELLQKALPRTRIVGPDTATDLNNWLFDFLVKNRVSRSRVFHFVNTLGVASARAVRDRGGFVVCDSRQEHPLTQDAILSREAEARGLSTKAQHGRPTARMLDELRASHHLIVPSQFARDSFVEHGIDPAIISVIPYGFDPAFFSPAATKPGRPFTILFVGGLSLRKGVLYLLEAVKSLKDPSLRVLCIGSVELAIEPLLSAYRGLFDHIPSVPKVELRRYYGAADVFVLPSLTDAYPFHP